MRTSRPWTPQDSRASNLIDSWWRRRTDGWIAGVEYSMGGGTEGPGVHLVVKQESEEAAGLDVPLRILLKAFDRVRRLTCHRCHTTAWRFDGPGRRYVRHGCAAARRAYLLAEKGRFKERCRTAVRVGWFYHPLAKVLGRRSRKILKTQGTRTLWLRLKFALGDYTYADTAVKSGHWLVGAIYAMNANGMPHEAIAAETGLREVDVALVLDWADAVARRHADRIFRRHRRR